MALDSAQRDNSGETTAQPRTLIWKIRSGPLLEGVTSSLDDGEQSVFPGTLPLRHSTPSIDIPIPPPATSATGASCYNPLPLLSLCPAPQLMAHIAPMHTASSSASTTINTIASGATVADASSSSMSIDSFPVASGNFQATLEKLGSLQQHPFQCSPCTRSKECSRGRSFHSLEVWDSHKDTIKRLYLDERRTLKEVMSIMKEQHNFKAT